MPFKQKKIVVGANKSMVGVNPYLSIVNVAKSPVNESNKFFSREHLINVTDQFFFRRYRQLGTP